MEAFRSYAIVSSINGAHETDIELRDTADELLSCNYIKIDASGNASDTRYNRYRVTLNSTGLTTPLSNQVAASGDIGSTSGTESFYGDLKTPIELTLADTDRVSSFRLSQYLDGNVIYLITYGQVKKVSPRRNNLRNRGA
jgi:hypothetical protein